MLSTRRLLALLLLSCLVMVSAANAEEGGPHEPAEAAEETDPPADDDVDPSDEPDTEPPPIETQIELSEGIEEITILGEQASELTDAPTSVTSFSAQELADLRIYDLRDLSAYTPNLEIQSSFASSNPTLFIRGVGLDDVNANAAAAVAIYYNDIYMNSPSGVLTQLFDIESVEVLRGPQGSVYGRNASAGAIVVKHREPSDELEADLSASFGNLGLIEVSGALGVPIFPDVLAGRVAFKYYDRDGFITNRCGLDPLNCGARLVDPIPSGLPDKVNDRSNWAARGMLRFDVPSSEFDMNWLLNAHGSRNDDGATQFQHVAARSPLRGTPPDRRICQPDLGEDPPCRDKSSYVDRDGDLFAGDYNRVGKEKLDTWGASLTGDWAFGDWVLRSITSYEWNDRTTEENTDANPNLLLETTYRNSADQFSQELRFDWSDGAEWTVTGGAYLLGEDLDVHNTFENRGTRFRFIDQTFTQESLAIAAYGHATWDILDDFTIDAGLRFNWERKDFDIDAVVTVPNAGGVIQGAAGQQRKTWSAPTGEFSITYRPTEEVRFYGKYSRGWKPGHFNGGAVFVGQIVSAIDPEEVNAFEVGLKSTWWGARISFDVSAFYYDYTNLQVFNVQNSEGGLPLLQLINANDAEVYGAEIDFGLRPLEGLVSLDDLTIAINFGWLETEYKDFTSTVKQNLGRGQGSVDVPVVYTGNPLIGAPRFSLAGSVEWSLPLFGSDSSWGSFVPRYDFTYKDETFFDPSGGSGVFGEYLNHSVLGQKSYWLHNLRLAYRSPDERWEVAGWVRNLTDKAYTVDAVDLSLAFGFILQAVGDPRTYGGTITVRF
jgi:iron complex outermembrane receptor protein